MDDGDNYRPASQPLVLKDIEDKLESFLLSRTLSSSSKHLLPGLRSIRDRVDTTIHLIEEYEAGDGGNR